MLPREVWENGRKKKLPALRYGASNYDYVIYRAAREITTCLEKWLNVPLDYNETYLPAALMLNHFDGPVWMHSDQGQEIGPIRNVIKETRSALRLVQEAIKLEKLGEQSGSEIKLTRALSRMRELPPPVNLSIERADCRTPLEWSNFLEHIHALYIGYAEQRKGYSGHRRARTVAIVVRALFEIHYDKPITLGITEQVPEGDYGKCVQEVFSWAGINVNFYRYALEAYKKRLDDRQLRECIDILQKHYSEKTPTPEGPITYQVR